MKLDFSRISSRFSEYGFQFLRCADKTSSTFGFMSGEQHINIYISQLENESRSRLRFPDAKRGQPRGASRSYTPPVSS